MVESMQQSSATPKNRDVGRGLRKIEGGRGERGDKGGRTGGEGEWRRGRGEGKKACNLV